MEYHSDRFKDMSLLIFKDEELVGILPANKVENVVYSHQGLTYGGPILSDNLSLSEIENILNTLNHYLKSENISTLKLKGLPKFYGNDQYHKLAEYLQKSADEIYRSDKVLAIDYSQPFTIHKTKLKHYRKNQDKEFVIREVDDLSTFWNVVLIPRLQEKHKVKPVHTLEEIMLLKSRFPDNIRQFNIYLEDEVLAGITIFDKGKVVKSQYGATTQRGEKERALEFLFLELIYKYKDEGKHFFSMGTVTEDNELGYNKGLLKQKEELGCTEYSQDFYSFRIK
ncbi:MAG: GNAT family N-acetyltransferase [Bacteroidota bacterium]